MLLGEGMGRKALLIQEILETHLDAVEIINEARGLWLTSFRSSDGHRGVIIYRLYDDASVEPSLAAGGKV
jgi:hypothetical protein